MTFPSFLKIRISRWHHPNLSLTWQIFQIFANFAPGHIDICHGDVKKHCQRLIKKKLYKIRTSRRAAPENEIFV